MKILFIGTVLFSRRALQKLIDIKAEVVGVITKKSSSVNADFADLSPICEKNNIPYLFSKDINSPDTIQWIKNHSPDVLFCFGWSSLLKNEILNVSPLGVVGFHPAALPQNRGRHPLIWALALGLTQTATTFFFMDEGADSGDILSQRFITIDYTDDAALLYEKMTQTALDQIASFVPTLAGGQYERVSQDNTRANYWRKRTEADGLIDFRMSSRSVYNLVRSLTKPYVGAHVCYRGQPVKIWKAGEVKCDKINCEPGKVLCSSEAGILVKTGHDAILLTEHEFEKTPLEGEYLL